MIAGDGGGRWASAVEGVGELAAAGDAELGVGALQVVVDGAHRQEQAVGDLPAGRAAGGQQRDLPLAARQPVGLGRRGQAGGPGPLAPIDQGGDPRAGGRGAPRRMPPSSARRRSSEAASAANSSAPICLELVRRGGGQVGVAACRAPGRGGGGWRPADRRRARRTPRGGAPRRARRRGAPGRGARRSRWRTGPSSRPARRAGPQLVAGLGQIAPGRRRPRPGRGGSRRPSAAPGSGRARRARRWRRRRWPGRPSGRRPGPGRRAPSAGPGWAEVAEQGRDLAEQVGGRLQPALGQAHPARAPTRTTPGRRGWPARRDRA